jgi:DNA-binding IclR family transcriptional regulator
MSVERALTLLSYIAKHPGEHGVRALASELELSPSTVARLLGAMESQRYVRQNPDTGKYRVGVEAVQLGVAAISSYDLTTTAPRYLQALTDRTGETTFLAVRDGAYVTYLAKIEGVHAVRTTSTLGSRRPVHSTALGKSFLACMSNDEVRELLAGATLVRATPQTLTRIPALLADLAHVRAVGYAVDREEMEVGLACIGAPVWDATGSTIAAISLSGPSMRVLPQERAFGELVASIALELSRELGYSGSGWQAINGSAAKVATG